MHYVKPVIVIALFALALPASAFSLWNRPTDDSVCDFSPWTSYRLLTRNKINIPHVVPEHEQVEGYARLALREAAANCKDAQTIILHSNDGSDLDAQIFREVSATLCAVAEITQRTVPTKDSPKAFEVRCRISKMKQAKAIVSKKEAEKPTEAFIRESYERVISASKPTSTPEWPEKKSNKMCVGQVLGIGGGCD